MTKRRVAELLLARGHAKTMDEALRMAADTKGAARVLLLGDHGEEAPMAEHVARSDACAICVQPRRTPRCPHPWDRPFDKWPKDLLAKLCIIVQGDPRPGS